MATRIGVLALQGAFAEHAAMLRQLGAEAIEVRKPAHLDRLDGLIVPGGESTAISRLIRSSGLSEPLQTFVSERPTWGTCAGAILLAREIQAESPHLPAIDISIRRNAFGRQIDSFIEPLEIDGIAGASFEAVFIRAPIITRAGSTVRVLARTRQGAIVAAQEGHILVTSFHPELTVDSRMHGYFLQLVQRITPVQRGN
jgi:5'-phosphate synthase pdxT subunit